jgi:Skp family chaperone for outer membrane proteins
MKTLRLVVVSMVFAGLLAVSVMAQAQPTGKIGLVNIFALEGKDGVTKYVNALNSLEAEFKKDVTELQTMATAIQTKTTELNTLREQAQKPNSPISRESLIAKATELDKLQRDAKFKQEDLQVRVNTRRQVVIGPIWNDMMKALQTFATQKGYAVILDGAKLEQEGILMAFDNKYDITKEFITYFNANPTGTATK